MGFHDLLSKNGRFGGQNRGRGGAILTPNELVLTFRGSYVCANFGDNRSRNANVRVPTDRQADRQTQTDFITALHVMQTRHSDENSVRPPVRLSVRPSVCHTRDP